MIVTIQNNNSYKIETSLYSNNNYIGTYCNSYYWEEVKSDLFIEQLVRLLIEQAKTTSDLLADGETQDSKNRKNQKEGDN